MQLSLSFIDVYGQNHTYHMKNRLINSLYRLPHLVLLVLLAAAKTTLKAQNKPGKLIGQTVRQGKADRAGRQAYKADRVTR
jgi:hypothetical protein